MNNSWVYVSGAISVVTFLVAAAGLSTGAALLWRFERRASVFLWVAVALMFVKSVTTPILTVVASRFGVDSGAMILVWGVEGALSMVNWLLIAGAFVLIARALRDPARAQPPPAR